MRPVLNATPCLLLILVATACSRHELPALEHPDEIVYQTAIYSADDGTMTSKTTAITRAAQREQVLARLQPIETEGPVRQATIYQDGSCAGRSLWLFDEINTSGNQLCLFVGNANNNTVPVSNYPRANMFSGWVGNIRSYWAGQDPGAFHLGRATSPFAAFEQKNSVTSTVQNAATISMVCGTSYNLDGGCVPN